jgi:membrane fusion protein, heavy metal efflux system
MFKFKFSLVHIIAIPALIAAAAIYIGHFKKTALAPAEAESITQETQDQSKVVKMDDDALKEFNVDTGIAGPGRIEVYKIIPAEIAFNADRLSHIVPRVPGVVREVRKNLGETVKAGDVLAIIESRELADAKAAYLAATEKIILAESNFKREETLWQKKISAEQDYLDAKSTLADTKIALRAAEQKLHALGFTEEYLKELPNRPEESFIEYEIVSPIDGTIVEKHIVLGEVLKEDSLPFVVADLSSVWINFNIHQKDLPFIKTGQPVNITAGKLQTNSTIKYVSSSVHEETRTALARVEIPNTDRQWRPGLFATGKIVVEDIDVAVSVPKKAIVMLDGKDSVFVKTQNGFEPQAVTLGRVNDVNIEVVSGLKQGQEYALKGAFTLKSELMKPTEEE